MLERCCRTSIVMNYCTTNGPADTCITSKGDNSTFLLPIASPGLLEEQILSHLQKSADMLLKIANDFAVICHDTLKQIKKIFETQTLVN